MRKLIFPILAAGLGLAFVGCAGPEHKLGRGISNTYELVRWGDMRRTIEQTSVLNCPDSGYTYGAYSGFHKSVVRAGTGIYEVLTFPLPPYHPIFTNYISARPVSPESYKPTLISDPLFDTDTFTGFSGGDVAPFIPGSRFRVFDN
ncbi:MAG TPA: exosortase system-associated protein, TIGR04073 family [Verrucomicrobiae bacterium]